MILYFIVCIAIWLEVAVLVGLGIAPSNFDGHE